MDNISALLPGMRLCLEVGLFRSYSTWQPMVLNALSRGTCRHAQGGDPTGTGTGGESVYGKPFRDEFDSRLTHTGRGVLAMANRSAPFLSL